MKVSSSNLAVLVAAAAVLPCTSAFVLLPKAAFSGRPSKKIVDAPVSSCSFLYESHHHYAALKAAATTTTTTEEEIDADLLAFQEIHARKYNSAAQMGFWMPSKAWATKHLAGAIREVREAKEEPLNDVVQAFKTTCEENSIYRMGITLMIDQANHWVKHHVASIPNITLDGDTAYIQDFDELFAMISYFISRSPAFSHTAMVGTPLNGLLAVSMGTEAGTALFHDETFNQEFKKVLNEWNRYLKSSESLYLLDPSKPEQEGSWISRAAKKAGVWTDMVIPDKNAMGYGYDSWNAFFIREFQKGARTWPKRSSVTAIGCETTPWQYENNLELESDFWIKDAKYSLRDIFQDDDLAQDFVGGQIYQGFLSATHYHRWNCPVDDGKLIRAYTLPGTYFAQRPNQGEDQGTWEGTASQPYLTNVATRSVFIFDTPKMGRVALVMFGMVEVSTCKSLYDIPRGGEPVPLCFGDPLGHFEFGGSTHCMIFQKDKAILEDWAVHAVKHRNDDDPTPMGTVIARPARQ